MSRGEAHKALESAVEVSSMDVIAAQIVEEAERTLREAESAAVVDAAFRHANHLAQEHAMRFGFDYPEARK